MYLVNKDSVSLTRLASTTFGENAITERNNIQQWVKSEAINDILGEPLLIIQEEFDGWDKSSERLDLLALDKEKRLVIIENKRDDSGKEVTWQSIKYASYCSTLKTADIVNMYQKFLVIEKRGEESARDNILEFLGESLDEEHLVLNEGATQRIILVSNTYRVEVTSAVLWLLNFGVDIKCFEIKPFLNIDDMYLQVQQIIPIKDAAEYVNSINNKNKEDEIVKQNSSDLYKEFWAGFITLCKKENNMYANRNTASGNWLAVTLIKSGFSVSCEITQKLGGICRVLIGIDSTDKTLNKTRFNILYNNKEQIENEVDFQLDWQVREDRIQSRIVTESTEYSYANKDDWNKIYKFYHNTITKMEEVFSPYIEQMD